MGKKEFKRIIEKRVLSGDYRILTGEGCEGRSQGELLFVCRQLGMLCESERPFYYAKTGKSALIALHVAFDSKKNNARQVERLSEVLLEKRRILKKPDVMPPGRYKMLPPVSRGPGSARSYLINCIAAFTQQYHQLYAYKGMLQEEGIPASCRVKTCFFMEDTTPLGSYILGADGMHELVLPYVKQFLDLFERSDGLDYVFFGCFKGCSDTLWFMGREDIQCFRKKEIDLLRRNYFAFDVKKYEETV